MGYGIYFLMLNYKRPPLVEAVLEARFQKALSKEDVLSLAKKIKKEYPLEKNNIQISTEVAVSEKGIIQKNSIAEGRTLDKIGQQQSGVIIMPDVIAVVSRAPYQGWEELFSSFEYVWKINKDVSGIKPVGRIGARFVNRIDIPVSNDTKKINIADYLNIGIHCPDGIDIKNYDVSFSLVLEDDFCVNVRTVTVEPMVANTAALLLDIDIYSDKNIPMREDELFAKINSVRKRKNDLFESFITDKAREIFNGEVF